MNGNLAIEESVDNVVERTDTVRALFVVDSTFPGEGGAESQARKLAIALSSHNTTVEFVSPRVLKELPINDTVDGFLSHRINYPHIRILGAAIMMVRFAWYLFKRRNDFDVIHVHITRFLAAIAVLMRPLTGIPVITKISGYFEFSGGVLDPNARFNPVNALLRSALRRIDYVQTISVQTLERLKQAGFSDKQIQYIPNGIDTNEAIRKSGRDADQADRESTPLVFGYCGRIRRVKGTEILIKSFMDLVASDPSRKVKLRIAGGGRALEGFRQWVKEQGLEEKIELLGTIQDTHAFYKSLDVYIQPSFAEGLPNSVMEAMVAGLPILATDVGGNNDLVDHGSEGWLFEAGDGAALTALMQRCIDTPDELGSLGQRGRERIVRTYDFSSVIDDLMELYRGRKN